MKQESRKDFAIITTSRQTASGIKIDSYKVCVDGGSFKQVDSMADSAVEIIKSLNLKEWEKNRLIMHLRGC